VTEKEEKKSSHHTTHNSNSNTTPLFVMTATMEIMVPVIDSSGMMPFCASEDQKRTPKTLAIESAELVGETNVLPPTGCCSASSSLDQDRKSWLGLVTTYEPLKVGLDDDSSIEDDDEDMFDDDAFTFGDEDFQAIMSHEAMKRMSTSIALIPHGHGRPAAQTSADSPPQNSLFLPSHRSAPLLSDKVADISADSSPAASSVSYGHHLPRYKAGLFFVPLLRRVGTLLVY
jgi:hypothetical protein